VARSFIEGLYRETVGAFGPDLTIILDLPAEEGLARASGRGIAADRYESMELAFHRKLRDGFIDIARREPDRCVVLDARPQIEDISKKLIDIVRAKLGGGNG
jgi:dTMP kinase